MGTLQPTNRVKAVSTGCILLQNPALIGERLAAARREEAIRLVAERRAAAAAAEQPAEKQQVDRSVRNDRDAEVDQY
jgi:hypothetical protein